MAAAPSRIGHAHPALLWLTRSYLRARRAERSRAGRAFRVRGPANGQASARCAALGATGFSTCPHRRHSRRASHFTMFMPHFGHGGRTSKQVNACSLVRRELCSFRRQAWPIVWRLWITIAIKGARRDGSLRYPLLLSAADRGENLALNN
jgi:hypothetical protein